jgi:hypothetical protein
VRGWRWNAITCCLGMKVSPASVPSANRIHSMRCGSRCQTCLTTPAPKMCRADTEISSPSKRCAPCFCGSIEPKCSRLPERPTYITPPSTTEGICAIEPWLSSGVGLRRLGGRLLVEVGGAKHPFDVGRADDQRAGRHRPLHVDQRGAVRRAQPPDDGAVVGIEVYGEILRQIVDRGPERDPCGTATAWAPPRRSRSESRCRCPRPAPTSGRWRR